MSLNSIEVRPSLESPETVSFAASTLPLMQEQMDIAAKACAEIERIQKLINCRLNAEYGCFLKALEEKAPELAEHFPKARVHTRISYDFDIHNATQRLHGALLDQWLDLKEFARLFDHIGGDHE